jgi:putative pyruvate formate lyase activating enzyme
MGEQSLEHAGTGPRPSSSRPPSSWPAYLALHGSGQLARRAEQARSRLRRCTMCPRHCRVDRLAGELGSCRTGAQARVASAGPHFGEEAPLVGRGGSGTIFFAGCNLACLFCQNHDISQPPGDPDPTAARAKTDSAFSGRALRWEVSAEHLARLMLELQALGCHNVNLVSPSHVVPQILEALMLAADRGLRLPLVYNTGGYDSISTLRLLDGVIDIYMPDMKYADEAVGKELSGVPDYVVRNRAAVREMHRQVGDLELDERGVARRGLLVRHLVLPGGLAGTEEVARFLATEVSPDTYLNVMDQYRPAHRILGGAISSWPELRRRLTVAEYQAAVAAVRKAGLWRLDGYV